MGLPLGSILTFIEQHSQWAMLAMFALLALESFGLPVPGETALIACSVLASQGSSLDRLGPRRRSTCGR